MRVVRILVVVLWTIASLTSVGAAASACEHGADGAATVDVMDHGAMMADHADMAGHGNHHPDAGCEQDCCEGACACEGLASAAAILPGSGMPGELPTDADAERLDASAAGLTTAAEGPPPRA